MEVDQAIEVLQQTSANPGNLTARTFEEEGERSAATTADREEIASLKLKAPMFVRPHERFELAIPAYEQFQTDATADNTETFELAHSVMECANTQDLVIWEGGSYQGAAGATEGVDYQNNSFDYADTGAETTLHVWYMSDAAADFEIRKVLSNGNSHQGLYGENLRLVNKTNLSEQPEDPDVGESKLNPAIAREMVVEVYLDAPYEFRWEDPNGDGAHPTNLVFSYPVNRAQQQIPGLEQAISTDMAEA